MNDAWFRKKYGKLKVLDSVSCRTPVVNTAPNDKNRRLMLKFKYGNLTKAEENEFHESVKNLIYKAMHTNSVMMDWEDVYQEIWMKITKSKHTWDENKGTYVSTWITIVASTVINTLRSSVRRRESHVLLYDDVLPSSEASGHEASTDYKMNSLFEHSSDMEDQSSRRYFWYSQYDEFLASLDEAEKAVMEAIKQMEDKFVRAYEKKRTTLPFKEVCDALGYDEATFHVILYNIRRKYCEAFDRPCPEEEISSDADGSCFLF